MNKKVSVVIATHNRARLLLRTLERLVALPEQPRVIVVDNGSRDDTGRLVKRAFPSVRVVRLKRNRGAAARTIGAHVATTPYVAFSDDDCWWEAGALQHATRLLDAHADVAVLNARVLVGSSNRLDDACRRMQQSELHKRSACAGTSIAGFMAGAVVARRRAFLAAGGYHKRYHIGAEESLLAVDLLDAGWELIYCDALVLHHHPAAEERDDRERRRLVFRNRLWTAWLRQSAWQALKTTASGALAACGDPLARAALNDAVRGLPWILRERRPAAFGVQQQTLRLIDPLA